MTTLPPPHDITQEEPLREEGLALYLRLRRAWRTEFHSPTGNPETLASLTRQLVALEASFPHLVQR